MGSAQILKNEECGTKGFAHARRLILCFVYSIVYTKHVTVLAVAMLLPAVCWCQ